MSKITIIKGKLLKGDKVEIEFLKQDSADESPVECFEKSSAIPKPEFKKAFADLAIHAALICEFIPLSSVKKIQNPDPEIIKDFNVSSFKIVAHEAEDEGIILTGQKTLRSGKKVGFNTPIIRFNDESETAYEHIDILDKAIDTCKDEIRKYLNGEHEADPQGKLDL